MAEMFSHATSYEKLMGRWSARLAPLFVDFAKVHDGDRVLDVGCGTGSLCQAVADIARRSEIVGIDPAQGFIDFCRSRFPDRGMSFDCGSALELPYPNSAFDKSLSLLVLMFIPQPERAAAEMRRVTRPGGTVAACTWDAEGMKMGSAFWEEAIRLDPAAKARADVSRQCNLKGQLTEIWIASGMNDVEETGIGIQMDFSSFDDYWLPMSASGPGGAYVATLSPDHCDALRAALRKRLFVDRPDGPFSLGALSWAVRGTVPSAIRV